MLRLLRRASLAVLVAAALPAVLAAQQPTVVETAAVDGPTGPARPDALNERPADAGKDAAHTDHAPTVRRAPRARGGNQPVCVVNFTQWFINFIVDDVNRGMLNPFQEHCFDVADGTHQFLGRADFKDGSTKRWGPKEITKSGSYEWRLTTSENVR